MSTDAFEAAFVDTLGAGSTAWYLKEHRIREDFYLFDNETLEKPNVVH